MRIADYFVVNHVAGQGATMEVTKFVDRLDRLDVFFGKVPKKIWVKYPQATDDPVPDIADPDGGGALTTYVSGPCVTPAQKLCFLEATRRGYEIGIYSPAPRTWLVPTRWIDYLAYAYACGVRHICFDAQAQRYPLDKYVHNLTRELGITVHAEPYAATSVYFGHADICQECSPLRPGEGLENALRVAGGKFPYPNNVTALITDRAPTREESLAYVRTWVERGCNVAVNAGGGWGKQGITAQDILDEAGVGA